MKRRHPEEGAAVQQAAEGLVLHGYQHYEMPLPHQAPPSTTLQSLYDSRPFVCPEPDCDKAYPSSAGLYQHKRAKHPWLINSRDSTEPKFDRRFVCSMPGCDKAYSSAAGLYQHKRAKHPWLINQRVGTRELQSDGEPRALTGPPENGRSGWLINRREPIEPRNNVERRFECEAMGCDKAYATSMGLYQHKRAKHPWLVKQRHPSIMWPAQAQAARSSALSSYTSLGKGSE